MTRQEANKEIVKKVSEMIEKYPDWRFHQILQNMWVESPGEDRWYEESEKTLEKLNMEVI